MPSALPALRTALAKEQDSQAQKAELRALINAGEKTEQLTQLLQSKDPAIRKAAIQGIAGNHGRRCVAVAPAAAAARFPDTFILLLSPPSGTA